MPVNIDPSFYKISAPNQAIIYGTTSPENQVAIAQGYENFLAGGGTPATLAPTPGAIEWVTQGPSELTPVDVADPYNTYDSPTANLVSENVAQISAYENALGYVNWRGKMKRQTNVTLAGFAEAMKTQGMSPGAVGKLIKESGRRNALGDFVINGKLMRNALRKMML